jgi:hypothetical protein
MLSHCCVFALRNGNIAASGGSREVNSTVKYIRQCVPQTGLRKYSVNLRTKSISSKRKLP